MTISRVYHEDVSNLLIRWQAGDSDALEKLTPLVYEELRKIGRIHLRSQRNVSLLEPTGLVHEAWIRMSRKQGIPVQHRGEFFALASRMMRGILVDHARKRLTQKRGGSWISVVFDETNAGTEPQLLEFILLDDALNRLAEIKPRYTQIAEMRFLGGLTIDEVSTVLGVSTATIEREWHVARRWLSRELSSRRRRSDT